MKIIKKLSLVIITGMLFTSVLTSSCRKEEAISRLVVVQHNDTVQYAWNQVTNTYYSFGQYMTNSYAYGNGNLIFMCNDGSWFTYDSTLNQWGQGNSNLVNSLYGASSEARRIPACKNFYVEVTNTKFEIHNPWSFSSSPQYQFNQLDTSLRLGCLESSFSIFEHDVDINDSNRVIFPVSTYFRSVKFLLIDIKYNSSNGTFDTLNKKEVISPSSGTVSGHIKNNFFFTASVIHDSTYLITPNYAVTPVCPDLLFSFFSWNNNYYAIGTDQVAIYQTNNFGQSWTKLFNISTYLTGIFNFDNKLIAFVRDQIFLVTMTSTTINFKEIANSGLTGKIITSIAKSNGVVYISTNQGIYQRPYTNFYTYK